MADVLIPQLVELATTEVMARMQARFNDNLEIVYGKYTDAVSGPINLPKIPADKFYISDAIDPLIVPAVFVVADRTDHDLTTAQNVAKQRHRMFVAVLGYDVEIQRLTRMSWRYATAAWITLHDANLGTCHSLVRAIDYSPTYRSRGAKDVAGNRGFRKDVTLELEVLQYEAFQTPVPSLLG